MRKKLTRGQKAAATRKANQLKASREIATKIGIIKVSENEMPFDKASPTKILTLCEQLEETITRLENRVSNSIARINALIGVI